MVVLEQLDGGSECNKLFHTGHVYAVIVGVSDLGTTAHQYYLAWVESVQYAKDTLLECGATHNTIVYYHEVVHIRNQATISDVIYMSCQFVSAVAFCDKGA